MTAMSIGGLPRASGTSVACHRPARAPGSTTERALELRWLSDEYVHVQKLRIAVENRARHAAWSPRSERRQDAHAVLSEELRQLERELVRRMGSAIRQHPAMPWLAAVRGIGPTLAAKILGQIGDIGRFETIPKLWRFAGYGVVRTRCPCCQSGAAPRGTCRRCAGSGAVGRREVQARGVRASFNATLKTTLYQVAMSFMRCDSPYRVVYDRARQRYAEREAAMPQTGRWSPAHCHQAALRQMIKAFLADLFVEWRAAEGLEAPSSMCLRPAPPASGREPVRTSGECGVSGGG